MEDDSGGGSSGRYQLLVGNQSLHERSQLINRGLLETRLNPTYPAAQFLGQTGLEMEVPLLLPLRPKRTSHVPSVSTGCFQTTVRISL